MKITCSACGKAHSSNAKLEASLEKLQPGQKLRLKCSQCGEAIALAREDLGIRGVTSAGSIHPPSPPDTSWLQEGAFEAEDVVADIPRAIVLMKPGETRDQVSAALSGLGYQAEAADDPAQIVKRMQFSNYTCVVMHAGVANGELAGNPLHNYMCSLEMDRRRYIFYILFGPEFKTFYNIQALSNSANLVVNESDMSHFGIILRKAIPEYEELFGPYMDELKIQGK